MQEQKQFKNSPEVRAYLAKVKRDYRARKKAVFPLLNLKESKSKS